MSKNYTENGVKVDEITPEFINNLKNLNTLLENKLEANRACLALLEKTYNEYQQLKNRSRNLPIN